MRRVACGAALKFKWAVFEYERTLFVRVTLYACRVRAKGQLGLFLLESAVRIMAVAALHRAFQHFVMEGFAELCFGLVMT